MIVSLNKDIKIASVALRKLNGKKNRGSAAGCAPSLILKARVFGTRKWTIFELS